eukprot:COSAG01_NODE_67628_length_266_cov_0.934132_1_plen_32_part_10
MTDSLQTDQPVLRMTTSRARPRRWEETISYAA